ncbi:MAG: hypothetical protein QM831_20125 [Kofleriaceae bacterium]
MKYALIFMAACGSFQDPNVVIDTRVLAITADPPEQVIDVTGQDLQNPDFTALFAQVMPTHVCALVSDRQFDRSLRYTWTLCVTDTDDRCDTDYMSYDIATGIQPDPDPFDAAPFCLDIQPDDKVEATVLTSLKNDQYHGLGGIYYSALLTVGGADADPADDIVAEKALRLMPNIPVEVTQNHNPTMAGLVASDPNADMTNPQPVALNACDAPNAQKLEVTPRQKIRLTPVEPDGVRETYVAPTLSGGGETLTESITYQWTITDGDLSDGNTGGGHDPFGNLAPLFTDYTAPYAEDLDGPEDVQVWVVVRDERLGVAWYEACIHVTP